MTPDEHATRPSIFLRLRGSDDSGVELTWHEFHRRYAPLIRMFCRRAGWSHPDAEDVVQEVMLGFFRASPDFEYNPEKGRFRGYLKATTIRVMGRLARAAGRVEVSLRPDDPDTETWWADAWESALLSRAMADAVERVEPATWEAFELSTVRKVPTAEVAARLDWSEANVRQARSRVARLVRAAVERLRAEDDA